MVQEISQERFEALSYGRHPMAKTIGPEIGWFSTNNHRVLGILIHDIHDNDFSCVVLARDSDKIFKGIEFMVSIKTKDEAISKLKIEMINQAARTIESHYQDEQKAEFNIYEYKVKEENLHRHFKTLVNSKRWSPAKEIIREMVYAFKDPDGNYREQFQTTGFNSRLWELYLFGYFHENNFILDKEFSSPDFLVERERKYAIEAVTVNPSKSSETPALPKTDEDVQLLNQDFMPIRYGSSLYTKLKKEYWKKEHVKGLPFIIAIHDYHYENSMTWSRNALERYLYGINPTTHFDKNGNLEVKLEEIQKHEWGNKIIPSNFFAQPDTENISAVLFTNQATLTKFNRIGYLAGFGDKNIEMTRYVKYYNPDPNAVEPLKISRKVSDSDYKEYWREGLIMFHNPNAKHPIDPYEFPEISHAIVHAGEWLSIMVENFILSSSTMINMFCD